jgi:putative ABC transport system permease protein
MRILRSIFRRKLRAFLTIFGITIGVFALVVMGGIAEKLNLLVDGGVRYYGDKVIVNSADNAMMGLSTNPLPMDKLSDIRRVKGVKAAFAQVSLLMNKELDAVSMGNIPTIQAEEHGARRYESFKVAMQDGRDLVPSDHGVVVLGADLVKQLDAGIGGSVEIRDEDFEVVGVWEKTLTAPDTAVAMSMKDARRLFKASLPEALQQGLNEDRIATAFVVYPNDGVSPDVLATVINLKVDGVKAVGPSEFQRQIVDQLKIFTTMIFGIAIVSLLVGGLSVINTMTMSVSERTREIGVRMALGATDGAIMRQFIAESGVMGLIGGLSGLALGWLVANALNVAGEASGNQIFLVSGRLAIGSVAFAFALGIVSGLYPAWHAARLNPVQALRYE